MQLKSYHARVIQKSWGASMSTALISEKGLHHAKQSAVRRVTWVSRWPSHVVGLECQELADGTGYMQVITGPGFMYYYASDD